MLKGADGHKPRILWNRAMACWQCWSPAIWGSRIVGWGATPEAAYADWWGKA